MSNIDECDQFIQWYKENKTQFAELSKYILEKITNVVHDYGIEIVTKSSREKDINKLSEKCRKRVKKPNGTETYKYSDPKNQITDMAGVRIVVFINSDIPVMCRIIENLFDIDWKNSVNKRENLDTDKVGYLSIHYIVLLKNDDPKYNEYRNMKCEIQVRTLFQHAWAQIFHDRQYKPINGAVLPAELKRKTNLIAGNLEVLDMEIDYLVKQYNNFYNIYDNEKYQRLLDEKVSVDAIKKYLYINMGSKYKIYDHNMVLIMLKEFGVNTIRNFECIYNRKIAAKPQTY